MGASCCAPPSPKADPASRRALWIALVVNVAMFAVEMGAGIAGHSLALRADALDFLGDSAHYALSLAVANLALAWRARAALLKGVTLALFGVWILASTAWSVWHGGTPHAETMGAVGLAALVANLGVALLLFRHRAGDANMRSAWICSRNDAIGNVAVLAAAGGVFSLGSAWPDLIVAAIMAGLALWGAVQIISQARGELRNGVTAPSTPHYAHHA
jgi:Co/Zn/Cd efflux system component